MGPIDQHINAHYGSSLVIIVWLGICATGRAAGHSQLALMRQFGE
jgi:hypothetical protein